MISLALLGGSALAQTVREIPGPAENPPSSFRDVQYVDSRGCVFVRAGVDGRTIWVPRVNAQRKVLCGYPPSLTAAAKPEPSSPVSVAPVSAPVVAPKPEPAAKPRRVADAPRQKQADDYIDAPRAGSQPGTLRCPARAPIAERVPLATGGTVILCVSRPGLVEGGAAVPPAAVAAQPRQTAAAQTATVAPMAQQPVPQGRSTPLRITLAEPADPIDLVQPVVPKGYKLAWSDGRLNAKRAQGTARGQAQQDLVWTQETPARLVTRAERAKIRAAQQQQAVTMSTKGTAAAPRYVQVGSFGDPANAAAASARLAGLGLPVAKGRAASNGKSLQVVLAGPFADEASARQALRLARSNGFGDAILR